MIDSNEKYMDVNLLPDCEKIKLIESEVSRLLLQININVKYRGYSFLKDCVSYIVFNNLICFNLSKEIYPVVSKKNNVSCAMVEKSIRLAIDQASCMYDSKKKPTNDLEQCIKNMFLINHTKYAISCLSEIIRNNIYNKKYTNFNY